MYAAHVKLLAALCFCLLCAPGVRAGAPIGAAGPLLIVDASGKEHKLKTWSFAEGTRKLSWLTPAAGEALEFSEGTGAPLKTRIVTLIPLRHIRSITFDNKARTATVHIARKTEDLVLTGVTGYVGVNVVAVQAEADLGELGQAELRFQGGVPRGITAIRFPAPEPLPAPPQGRPARVVATDRTQTVHDLVDLQPLYARGPHDLHTDPHLYFQKTIEIDVGKVEKMSQVGEGTSRAGLVFDVTLQGGLQKPLVLIQTRPLEKRQVETLVGLVGRVAAGYKLVPPSTIGRLYFDAAIPTEPPAKAEGVK